MVRGPPVDLYFGNEELGQLRRKWAWDVCVFVVLTWPIWPWSSKYLLRFLFLGIDFGGSNSSSRLKDLEAWGDVLILLIRFRFSLWSSCWALVSMLCALPSERKNLLETNMTEQAKWDDEACQRWMAKCVPISSIPCPDQGKTSASLEAKQRIVISRVGFRCT